MRKKEHEKKEPKKGAGKHEHHKSIARELEKLAKHHHALADKHKGKDPEQGEKRGRKKHESEGKEGRKKGLTARGESDPGAGTKFFGI